MYQQASPKNLFISIFLLGYFFVINSVFAATPATPITAIKKVTNDMVMLSWSTSTPTPASYEVHRDGNLVKTTSGNVLGYIDTGLEARLYQYEVIAIDADGSRSTPAASETDLSNPSDTIEAALTSGNALLVADSEHLLDATLATIEANKTLLSTAKTQLFNLNVDGSTKADGSSLTAISWNPTHDATTLLSTYGVNTPVLRTNSVFVDGKTVYDKEIGIIGEQAGNTPSRYMVLGGNPMRNYHRNATSINDQMHSFLENSLAWLTNRDDLTTAPFNVVISHMDDGYYFPDDTATRSWLDEHFAGQVNYNAEDK